MKNLFSNSQIEQYRKDGYVIVSELFDAEEMALIRSKAKEDAELKEKNRGFQDGEGVVTQSTFLQKSEEDLYGLISSSPRVVDRMELLMGKKVYLYHSKMNAKAPLIGGAWEWHQDYGYWYSDGCLFSDMASCFLAVDENTRENGCLQVLAGSHRLGRIDHGQIGTQHGANPERINEITKRLKLFYCTLNPGDAIFFHSNTLHRSDQNKSSNPRWSFICCYNAEDNIPYNPTHNAGYKPLIKVNDNALKEHMSLAK